MKSNFTRWAALALLAGALPGCIATTPHWDGLFGDATRNNLAAQVVYPAAAASGNPALGLDGRAARAAVDNYQRSFERPASGQPAAMVGE